MAEAGTGYTCACCGKEFERGRDDVEARAEARSRGIDPDDPDNTIVCDDCFNIMVPELEGDEGFLERLMAWRLGLSAQSIGERVMVKFEEYPHLRRATIINAGFNPIAVEFDQDDDDPDDVFAGLVDLMLVYPAIPTR